jgi:type II secretory pathway pseudopilin PulG
MPKPPRQANDQGETLIELIIAIAIMGIAVVAIVSGIVTSILMSDVHRKQTTAGAIARNDAETLVSSGYSTSCNYTLPASSGFTVVINSVYHWDSTATPTPMFVAGCADTGLHKVRIKVSSTDVRATEYVDVVIRSTS